MPWIFLLLAGLFEIAWAIGLKYSQGFSRLWPSLGSLAAMAVSVLLLAVAAKQLPIGTAYAVWTGIGAIGTALLGMVLFGDAVTPWRLCCLGVLLLGMIGLKLEAVLR
jgi:quaternary ammonium compound-resistance protein SugE